MRAGAAVGAPGGGGPDAVPSVGQMEGRQERDPGYDDWFDEPEPPTDTAGRGQRGVYDADDDVWVLPATRRRRRPRGREIVVAGRTLTPAQAAIAAASLLALFFAILAAAGVFGAGGKTAAPPVTTSKPPPPVSPSVSTPAPTQPTVQVPTATLTPGDTGPQVKLLQRALNALGYSVGKPDGDFGPVTKTAVEKFQLAKGLAADGVVGPQTLAALRQALSG